MNKSVFEDMDDELRVQYEGYRPGMYVRVEIHQVPCEFVQNFDPTYPVILGGLLSVENNVGYVQVGKQPYGDFQIVPVSVLNQSNISLVMTYTCIMYPCYNRICLLIMKF